ncbi:MAG: glutaminyl-peptide cyclotransferase [Cyclobacteriaceae bacterium]
MQKITPFLVVLLFLVGCSKKESETETESPIIKKVTSIVSPSINEVVPLGSSIDFSVLSKDAKIDSVVIESGGNRESFQSGTFSWIPSTNRTGTFKFQLKAYYGGVEEVHYPRLKMLSDITPEEFQYVVIGSYAHDETAFTQGIFFQDNLLFESTGQEGESTIRKVDLVTGDVLVSKPIGDEYFGEGCTIYNGEIYQVTWTSNIGFVYDLDLNEKRSFRYGMEGWGLTTIGDSLLMTDGSSNMYFMNPTDFTEIDRIEVYTDEGPVTDLNEIEYINGMVYANEWQTDNIHVIDPKSGRVMKTIDMAGLLTPEEKQSADVLNGIAYDEEGDRLFVTGKYWPKLFEIKLQPKN